MLVLCFFTSLAIFCICTMPSNEFAGVSVVIQCSGLIPYLNYYRERATEIWWLGGINAMILIYQEPIMV